METILSLKEIYKSFDDNHVHQGVNFDLHKGESLGLLGGSGTGKSVLLRSIIGLETIDKGEILYKGRDISLLSEKEYLSVRLNISYSFQNGALFDSLNIFENLAFPLIEHTKQTIEQIREKIKYFLNLIGLAGKELLMPSDLSGGMQKRVGMARSMMLEPDIILYDEPTAGLDPANTKNIVNLMKKFKAEGQTSIFVTHDIPAALDLCDRIIVLGGGKVIFKGTPIEFLSSEDPDVQKFAESELKKGKEYDS